MQLNNLQNKNIVAFIFLVLILSFLSACDSNRIYETNINIEKSQWLADDSLTFNFSVPDSTKPYNVFYNIRYSKDYPYYNLYVRHTLYDSSGQKLESKLMNMNLFDPATGKPLGSGMGDVYDYSILVLSDKEFPYNGNYSLTAKQYMRDEPLQGIETFGLKISKPENGN